jgi:hypothetical protein
MKFDKNQAKDLSLFDEIFMINERKGYDLAMY